MDRREYKSYRYEIVSNWGGIVMVAEFRTYSQMAGDALATKLVRAMSNGSETNERFAYYFLEAK